MVLNQRERGSAPEDEMSRFRYKSLKSTILLPLLASSIWEEHDSNLDFGEHLRSTRETRMENELDDWSQHND